MHGYTCLKKKRKKIFETKLFAEQNIKIYAKSAKIRAKTFVTLRGEIFAEDISRNSSIRQNYQY